MKVKENKIKGQQDKIKAKDKLPTKGNSEIRKLTKKRSLNNKKNI